MYIKKSCPSKKKVYCFKEVDCTEKIPPLVGKVEKVLIGCGPPPSLDCYNKCILENCENEKPRGRGGGGDNKPGENNPYGSGGGGWRTPGSGRDRDFNESEEPYYINRENGQRYQQSKDDDGNSKWEIQQPKPPQASGNGSGSGSGSSSGQPTTQAVGRGGWNYTRVAGTGGSQEALNTLRNLKAAGCDVETMCPGINLKALEEAGTGYPGGFVPLGMDTSGSVSDSYTMSLGNGIPDPSQTGGLVHNQILFGPCGKVWVYKAPGTASNPSSIGVFKECQIRPPDFSSGQNNESISDYNPLNGTVGSGVEGGYEGSYVTSGQEEVPNPRLSSSAVNGQLYISPSGSLYRFIAPGYPGNSGVTGIWVPLNARPQTVQEVSEGNQSYIGFDPSLNIPTITDNINEGQVMVNKYGQLFIFENGSWKYFQLSPPNFSPECNYNPGATGTTNGTEDCDCCCDPSTGQHPQNYATTGFCNPTTTEGARNGQIYKNNRTGNEYIYDEKTNSWNPYGNGSGGGGGGGKRVTTTPSNPADLKPAPYGSGGGGGGGSSGSGAGGSYGGWFPGTGSQDGSPDGTVNVNEEDGSVSVLKDGEWEETGIKIDNISRLQKGITKPEYNSDINKSLLQTGDLYLDESTGIFYKYDNTNDKWEEISFTSLTNTSDTSYGSKPHSGNIYGYGQASNDTSKEGDISIDEITGEVREYRNGGWVNSGYSFDISKGMQIGYGVPPYTTNGYTEGSYYIDKETGQVYQVSSGEWISVGYSLYGDCCQKYSNRYTNGIFYTTSFEGGPDGQGIKANEGDMTMSIDPQTGDGVFYKFTENEWVKTDTSIDIKYNTSGGFDNLIVSSLPPKPVPVSPPPSYSLPTDGAYHLDTHAGILYTYDGIAQQWIKVKMGDINGNNDKGIGVYTGAIYQFTGIGGTEGDISINTTTGYVNEFRNGHWIALYRLDSYFDTGGSNTYHYIIGFGIPTSTVETRDGINYIDKITGNVYYYVKDTNKWKYKYNIYPYNNVFPSASPVISDIQ